ncbi:MAG: TPM domain-containing protein [Bacteriovorax sp.]
MIVSKKDRLLIKNLIDEAERKTKSEIVPMIVHHSDIYPAAHFRAAIIVSFLFSLILYFSPLTVINPIYFLWIQLPGLYVGYFFGQIPLIKRCLITKDEMDLEVTQRAYTAFFQHNLHLTENHNGVLILISVMEKKIKIIADIGINKKVEQKVWDEIVLAFTQKVQTGNFVDALKDTITATSNVLENYFPREGESAPNELDNDLIVE